MKVQATGRPAVKLFAARGGIPESATSPGSKQLREFSGLPSSSLHLASCTCGCSDVPKLLGLLQALDALNSFFRGLGNRKVVGTWRRTALLQRGSDPATEGLLGLKISHFSCKARFTSAKVDVTIALIQDSTSCLRPSSILAGLRWGIKKAVSVDGSLVLAVLN